MRDLRHGRRGLLVLTSLVSAATLLLPAGGLAAARPCGDRVLDDWADGRIDGVYAPECYAAALASLPEDLRAYSSAQEDIERALRERLTQDSAPPEQEEAPTPRATPRPQAAPKRSLSGPAATPPAATTAPETTPALAAPQTSEPPDAGGGAGWPLVAGLAAALLLLAGAVPLVRRVRAG